MQSNNYYWGIGFDYTGHYETFITTTFITKNKTIKKSFG
jgi:hypothetical protein